MPVGYDVWLTPDRLAAECEAWERDHQEARKAFLDDFKVLTDLVYPYVPGRRVLELGFGDGWFGRGLPEIYNWTGVDSNPHCHKVAQGKDIFAGAAGKDFILEDAAEFLSHCPRYDYAVTCQFLKHVPLEEFDSILSGMLLKCDAALFTMQTAQEDISDGEEYHHIWVDRSRLYRVISESGHRVVRERLLWADKDPALFREDVVYLTRRRNEAA